MNLAIKNSTIIFCLLMLINTDTFSLEYQAGIQLDDRLYVENNYFNSLSGNFKQDETYNIVAASPDFYLSFQKNTSLYLLADFSWIHSWDARDADEFDAELLNAYLSIHNKRISTDFGIQFFQLGRGFIMESNEPGVSLNYQGPGRYNINIEAVRIIDTSPIVSATLGYKLGFLEKVNVFGVWFRDSDNSVAEMLNYQDQALTDRWLYNRNRALWLLNQIDVLNFTKSSGNFFWYGASGDLFLKNIFISGILIIERASGSIEIETPPTIWNFSISSYLLDIEFNYNIDEDFSLGTFFFISGGLSDDQGNLNTFVSPMPNNSRASIFFSQSFNDQIGEDALSKGGLHWAGVIAPGVNVDYTVSDAFTFGGTLVSFFSEEKPSDTKSWYGWEADMNITYTIQNKYKLFFEAGFFQHGNFYKDQGQKPDPATRFVVGINTFF